VFLVRLKKTGAAQWTTWSSFEKNP